LLPRNGTRRFPEIPTLQGIWESYSDERTGAPGCGSDFLVDRPRNRILVDILGRQAQVCAVFSLPPLRLCSSFSYLTSIRTRPHPRLSGAERNNTVPHPAHPRAIRPKVASRSCRLGDDTRDFGRCGAHPPFLGRSGTQTLDPVIIVYREMSDTNESDVDGDF